jgi:glycosyltransferase involved in cell wall biosynthesis
MHVLWMSDDPDTPSGFGNVSRWVCEGLRRRGHKISIIGWQAQEPHEWNGCRVYPGGAEPLGKAALYPFLLRHRPEVVVTLADIWWLSYMNDPHIRRQLDMTGTPWALYFPVDGDCGGMLPPSWIELLRTVDIPIAMARYGQSAVQRAGLACEYIPHGVDTELFAPPPDRESAKARLGLQGKFVILSDSRNQPRKLLPRLLEIFALVAAECPRAFLHLHTDPDDEFTRTSGYSYDLRADIRALGLEGRVGLTPGLSVRKGGGIPLEALARYYQAADVHLLASSGEGFGLPTLQAAAAGAIPVAVAYSANEELIDGHGMTIRVGDWTHSAFGVRRALLDIDDAAAKLLRLAREPDLRADLSRRARAFAVGYAWDGLIDRWDSLLRSAPVRLRAAPPCATERSATIAALAPASARWPGATISVKFVERTAGALEAMIKADARAQGKDVTIPACPAACRVGNLVIPRQPGFVGLRAGDLDLFNALKSLFPILHGWTPDEIGKEADVEHLPLGAPQGARYALARSILLLDTGGGMPEDLLVDAAWLRIPCLHGGDPVAARFWPTLQASTTDEALVIARKLLTDESKYRHAADYARQTVDEEHACDETSMELWIRRLHLQESSRTANGS